MADGIETVILFGNQVQLNVTIQIQIKLFCEITKFALLVKFVFKFVKTICCQRPYRKVTWIMKKLFFFMRVGGASHQETSSLESFGDNGFVKSSSWGMPNLNIVT